MFQSIGPAEILLVLFIIIVLLGGKKIPELFKGLGEAVKEFKNASKDAEDKKDKE